MKGDRDTMTKGEMMQPGATNYPSYGSVFGREFGWQTGLPPYVLLARKRGVSYHGAGYFGAAAGMLELLDDPVRARRLGPAAREEVAAQWYHG